MSLSILIATIGQDGLIDLLNSLKTQLSNDDYIYVIVDGQDYHSKASEIMKEFNGYECNLEVIYEKENLGFWGHGIRNKYQKKLKGDYILHADDDDVYMEGAIDKIKSNISGNEGKMLLFKFYHDYSKKISFWRVPEIRLNNIGTPCGVIPNVPEKMGTWDYRYGGDFSFYDTCSFDHEFINEYIYVVKPKNNGYYE